jgi:alpha-1,6-mannosyltransferase
MKSLHMTNAWHASSGGIATHYRSLLAAAERSGHELVMVVPGEKDSCEAGKFTKIYTVGAGPSPLNPAYRTIFPNHWTGVNARVAAIVRQEKPDLIEVCDKYSLHYLAGQIRRGIFPGLEKRPVVVGLSCERMDDNLGVYLTRKTWGKAFAHWYMKWIYFGFFDHHITISKHTAEELQRAGRGHIAERGIWVRPLGVDLEVFDPKHRSEEEHARLAALAGGNSASRLVVYAGRLAPEKNLDLLIDTFAQLAADPNFDYRLLVAGSGIERERLEQASAERFPGRAHFLGHVGSREELARFYANGDVFVHTNPAEPFGIGPLEAMASGLAFVGPNSGGILSYADESNAWLSPPNGVEFAASVRASFDASERPQRIATGIQTAARYQATHVADGFLNLYQQFCSRQISAEPEFRSTPGSWLGAEL